MGVAGCPTFRKVVKGQAIPTSEDMEPRPAPLEGDGTTDALLASSTTAPAEQSGGEDGGGAADVADLPPGHPLLRRAQEALYQQLAATKLRLEEELQERRKELKVRWRWFCLAAPTWRLGRHAATPCLWKCIMCSLRLPP